MAINLEPLLAFIRKPESNGDYNAIWGRIAVADYPKKPLVEMTISEVLAWQDSIDKKYNSEAAGAYQFLEDTLRDIAPQAGMSLNSLFDKTTQDNLAVFLLRRRGLNDYLAGIISAETFANNLAKEWASLPVVTGPKKGRSYYAGDGLNAAHVKVADTLAAVRAINTPTTHQEKETMLPIGVGGLVARYVLVAAAGAFAANVGWFGYEEATNIVTIDLNQLNLGPLIGTAATAGGAVWWRKLAKNLGGKL